MQAKQAVATILGFMVLTLFGSTFVGATQFVRGDADGSGTVTYTADFDYVMAYLFSSGPAPDPWDSGDANDDGAVNIGDASYLATYDSGGPAPPAPFSSAGYDPTPDALDPEYDAILTVYDASLTTYLASSASGEQDIRPLVTQRGVSLDGQLRAPSGQPFHAAGNPYESSPIGDEVITEAVGTYTVFDRDIALPAKGFSWVVGRTYNARQATSGGSARDSDGYQGKNWFQTSQPEIVLYEGASDSKDVLYLIYGADRFLEFKRLDAPGASDTFRGVNGVAGAVEFTNGGASVPDTYVYTDQAGYEHTFFGFDGDAGAAAGQFWKTEDPAGNVAYVGHKTTPATAISSGYTSGRIQYAYDTSERRYTYTYTSLDSTQRLTRVVAETKTGGTWSGTPTGVAEVGRVDYTYYSSESHGDIGDLKTVMTTTPLSDSGESLEQTKYYRYYEGTYNASTNPGYPHGLKYIVGFEGCRNYDYNGAGDSSFDDDFLTALDSELEPYAEAAFEYDTSHRISEVWMSGACGCSGGISGSSSFTYGTNGSDATGYDEDEWRYRTIIERPDGGYSTHYFDEVAQRLARVVTDDDPSGSPTKTWGTLLDRDGAGRVSKHYTPASIGSYTHASGSFGAWSTAGLIRHNTRATAPPESGYVTTMKWSKGTIGTAYLDGSLEYSVDEIDVGDSIVARAFVSSVREYTSAITSGTSGSNLTEITTDVYTNTLVPEFVTVTLPDVSTGNNGEGTTPTTTVKHYFTKAGENCFSRSTDGRITYKEFSDGSLTTVTEDADTTSLSPPSGFASSGSGILDKTTTHTIDSTGRVEKTELPTGIENERYYTKLKDGRSVVLEYNDFSGSTFYGPVRYTVSNQAGKVELMATIGLPGNTSTAAQSTHIDEATDDPILAVNGSWDVARMRTTLYDSSGTRRTEARTYFSTPGSGSGTDGTHYDATTFGYDDSGRVCRTEEPHGTVRRAVFDLHGNVTEKWVGTNDYSFSGGDTSGPDNMVKTTAYEYDSGSGGGNQYLTKQTLFVEDSTTNQRATTYTNDVRGRRLLEANPESPHHFHKYDNLGRNVATGGFSSVASISVSADDPTTETANRISLEQSFFDERGRIWKSQVHKIDIADGSDDDQLETLTWYDRAGRVAKTDGSTLEKIYYDGMDRETHRFILASDNDTTYSHSLDVSGDTVLVESQRVYDASDDLILQCRIDRHHDDTGTGALDSNGDTDALAFTSGNIAGRIQIAALWYDSLSRVQDVVQYGTYGGATFDRDGLTAPTRSATALRTTYTYNNMGEQETSEDPRGITQYTGYDDLGRVTSTVANASAVPPGAPTGTDSNQTVLYEYTDGLLTLQTADMPSGTADQDTVYTYGTTKGSGTGDSEIASGHLLSEVQYPDSSGGSDVVTNAYNAQGELIWREDQGGNVFEHAYDDVGRLTSRTVTTVGSGFDGAVRRIGMTYTSLGQRDKTTQYSDTSGTTIVDQVQHSWNGWGKVKKFAQDHDSAITGSGNYYYDFESTWDIATGGRNTIRRETLQLPSGTGITINYGSGVDDNASRVTSLKSGATTLVSYEYNGFDQVVGTDYPVPDVFRNDYSGSSYPSLDRFNRVVTLQWVKDLTTDQEFVDLDYAYDENSNPTRVVDSIHQYSGIGAFDTLYSYDDLNRLTSSEQGNWTGSAINNDTEYRAWTLDHAGNWANEKLDLNGDGDYLDTGEHDKSRSHNEANEITSLHDETPTYDANGNLTDDGNEYKYEFDCFNRLRKVRDQSDNLLSEYRYNGLGYLIAVHNDADEDNDVDSSDPWYHYVYDERWRKIATYRDTDTRVKKESLFHEHGLGETTQLNDSVVRRERDADTAWTAAADGVDETLYYCQNWRGDVVALVEDDGKLVEWAKYSPYGESFGIPGGDTDGDFDTDSSDVTQIQSWIDTSTYNVFGDMDVDKDVDATDHSTADAAPYKNVTLGRGSLSARRSTTGFAGHGGDDELPQLRHVNDGVVVVGLGRRLQREPGLPSRLQAEQSAHASDLDDILNTFCTGTCGYICMATSQRLEYQTIGSAFQAPATVTGSGQVPAPTYPTGLRGSGGGTARRAPPGSQSAGAFSVYVTYLCGLVADTCDGPPLFDRTCGCEPGLVKEEFKGLVHVTSSGAFLVTPASVGLVNSISNFAWPSITAYVDCAWR